jgi:CBS domain-containing protein
LVEEAMHMRGQHVARWGVHELVGALGTVEEAMTRTVVCVSPEMAAAEAATLLQRRGVGGAPVVRDGGVVGVVTSSDLASPHPYARETGPFLRPRGGASAWSVADLMTESAVTAFAAEPLAAAVMSMAAARVDRLPVVDEEGRPVGIVARDDVIRILARALTAATASGDRPRPYLLPD